ncbi:MAG: hypothetical protein DME30_11290 [Verrucomicrobia bacterium]|nr:MAG: hypothetical protein DME30_11290 [Verrucomicrobiota bacterium]
MASFSFLPSLRTDKSFNVGLVVVIVFAVAEFFAASVHYLGRKHPAQTAVAAPRAMPAPLPSAAPSAPPVALAVASPIAALTPATSTVSVADRLRKQAEAARESGDTVSALARLQDASQRDPRNAEVLAEMAMIYESIQNFDRSAETWRRVQEIGPSSGPLYELADMKLKTGVPAAPESATGSALDAGRPASVLEASSVRSTAEGIPAGSALGITEVTASETPDPEWLTPNHDWADSNSETLAVTYIRPKSKAKSAESDLAAAAAAVNPAKKGKPVKASPPPEAGTRKYLGYIVQVYYDDQLQDKRADPPSLLKRYPAPSTAPPQ